MRDGIRTNSGAIRDNSGKTLKQNNEKILKFEKLSLMCEIEAFRRTPGLLSKKTPNNH